MPIKGTLKRNGEKVTMMDLKCPICNRWFSANRPDVHIAKYHAGASDYDLLAIRDARRQSKSFFQETKVKRKNHTLKNINKSDGTTFSGGLASLGKKR